MKEKRRTIRCPHCGELIELADDEQKPRRLSTTRTLVACIIVSVIICAVGFGIYMHADARREAEAWEVAMQSNDVMTVKAYLDTYRQAPVEHRSEAGELLTRLENEANEWSRVVASGAAADYLSFAKQHSDSRYAPIAMQKADSITYAEACTTNTAERFESYVQTFPQGRYVAEAQQKAETLRMATIEPEDRIAAEMVASGLIAAVSSHDEQSLLSLMADTLQAFMGDKKVPRRMTSRLLGALGGSAGSSTNWMEPTNIDVTRSQDAATSKPRKGYIDVKFESTRTLTDSKATRKTLYRFSLTLNPHSQISSLTLTSQLVKE